MALSPEKLPSILGFRPTGDVGPFTFYTKSNGTIVFFPRAPPKIPPSLFQLYQRGRFTAAAAAWKALPEKTRTNWEQATKTLSLKLNGLNLFTWHYLNPDHAAIATIERQSSLNLHATEP